MNFKDQLALDLAVFLNPAEFAELIRIEGVDYPVPAVVEDATLDYPEQMLGGLRAKTQRVHLATQHLPSMVEVGRTLHINDTEWIVQHIADECGMTTLLLTHEVY